jgi:HAAS
MPTMTTDPIVEEYLRRLDSAAASLPRHRRAELLAEIREHVDNALLETDADDEVAVRNVLARLGPPEEIVSAAEPPATGRSAGRLEIAALIAMVVPFIGWVFGIVLVLASHAWSAREKLVGVTLALIPVLLPLVGFVAAGDSGGAEEITPGEFPVGEQESGGDAGLGPIEVAALLFLFVGGVPSALFLGTRLRSRPRTAI